MTNGGWRSRLGRLAPAGGDASARPDAGMDAAERKPTSAGKADRHTRTGPPAQPPRPFARHAAPSGREARERGDISIVAAGIVPALLLVIGLVVDGGAKLQANDQAYYAAEQAARAAGQQINLTSLAHGEVPTLDVPRAVAAAHASLDASGATGTVDIVGGDRVRVQANTTFEPTFLAFVGVDELSSTATAEIRLARGVTREEP